MIFLSDDGPWVFLVLTVVIGGAGAFFSGRGLARSWKPFWRIFLYMALLATAMRFFHYALFDGTLTSLYYYLVTYAILLIAPCSASAPCGPRRWSRNIAGSMSARAPSPGGTGRKGQSWCLRFRRMP